MQRAFLPQVNQEPVQRLQHCEAVQVAATRQEVPQQIKAQLLHNNSERQPLQVHELLVLLRVAGVGQGEEEQRQPGVVDVQQEQVRRRSGEERFR